MMMTDISALLQTIDRLNAEEFAQLYDHMRQRSRVTWWIISPDRLRELETVLQPIHEEAAHMSEDEINEAIDAAIAEVRRDS
jgi:hypothetical protein